MVFGALDKKSFAYLADLKLDSGAVNVIFSVVNQLVKALYLDKIQDSDLLKINLGIIKVDALYDGKLLHVNLLGLDISVGLSKKSTDNNQQTDLAIITIGDSSIKLPCDENGLLNDNDAKSNISVSLIKANRTKITDSNVYGVSQGYDVYAGGAGNNNDGDAKDGRSGGFVGFNDEGLLKNNNMYYCDVVRGTKDLVGPFSGKSELDANGNRTDKLKPGSEQLISYDDVDFDSKNIGPTGFGMAFDFGATYRLNDEWTFSAALLDLGFIRWKNTVKATMNNSFEFDGFNEIPVKSDLGDNDPNSIDNQSDRIVDDLEQMSKFTKEGEGLKRATALAATLNLGAEYTLPAYDRLKFGFLSSSRFQGRHSWTEARVSANVSPLTYELYTLYRRKNRSPHLTEPHHTFCRIRKHVSREPSFTGTL